MKPEQTIMAQWMGQYSGLTHATKVEDIERSLRRAVKAYAAAGAEDKAQKAKAARDLAERLLAARLKLIGATISRLMEPDWRKSPSEQRVTHLKLREKELAREGIEGIVKEFGLE